MYCLKNLSVVGMLLGLCSWNALSETSATTNALSVQPLNQQNVVTNQLNRQTLQTQAQTWGLTESEWQRYQALEQGERGIWSPGLDPLTVLGVESRNEQEREHYARLLANKMHDRMERELQFQRTYDRVFAELYPNEQPFTVEPHISERIGRVIYFTRLDNCDKCESNADRMLSYVNEKTPIDIYFVDVKSNDDIYAWAKKHHIDPNKVQKKLITLNHDSGAWLQYADGKMPAAFQIQKDGKWEKIVY